MCASTIVRRAHMNSRSGIPQHQMMQPIAAILNAAEELQVQPQHAYLMAPWCHVPTKMGQKSHRKVTPRARYFTRNEARQTFPEKRRC